MPGGLQLDVLGALIIMQQNDKIKAQNKGDKDSIITCNVVSAMTPVYAQLTVCSGSHKIIRSLEQEKASMRRQSVEQVAQGLMVGQNDIYGNKHGLDTNNDHKVVCRCIAAASLTLFMQISHTEFCSGFKQWFDNKKSMGETNNLEAIFNAHFQESMKNMFG